MSIAGIQRVTGSEHIALYHGRGAAAVEDPLGNRNTGPDTVSFSEEALRMAQDQSADDIAVRESQTSRDRLRTDESAGNASKSSTGLNKKSLFSLLLESLFLADLEESAAGGAEAGGAENKQAADGGTPGRKTDKAMPVNPLRDAEKSAELRRVVSGFIQGKADLSDLPKAMAGGAGGAKSPAAKSGGDKDKKIAA